MEARAPQWLRSAGLEWCWRVSREPKRLRLRYLRDVVITADMIRERIEPAGYH
jgi:UDP-N-acetyl-D-mannosaminuronic acid transferase (WecB/TagA/CpsF family)